MPKPDESREEMTEWLRKEFGESAVKIANAFIDDPNPHPFEERARLMQELWYMRFAHKNGK